MGPPSGLPTSNDQRLAPFFGFDTYAYLKVALPAKTASLWTFSKRRPSILNEPHCIP